MKQKSHKRVIAWIFLILLTLSLLALNYIKFFGQPNHNIEEVPVEGSTSKAIDTALKDIVINFNKNDKIQEYANQDITVKAVLNQYSIFISYTTDITVTYEFFYQDLNLKIAVEDDPENIEIFNKIYTILIEAIQERIGNEENIDDEITNFLAGLETYDGLEVIKDEGLIKYRVDITKKIGIQDNIEVDENNSQSSQEDTTKGNTLETT